MHTTIISAASVERLVDEDALTCPGCREQVQAKPPIRRPGTVHTVICWEGVEFCHRDGSAL